MPSSPPRSSLRTRPIPHLTPPQNKIIHDLTEFKAESMDPPPLEKLRVDLTESDKENEQMEEDNLSVASLSPPTNNASPKKHNGSPNKSQNDDESSSEEESESESESDSDDDDNPMFAGLTAEQKAKLKEKMNGMRSIYDKTCQQREQERIQQIQHQIVSVLSVEVNDKQAAFISDFVRDNHLDLVERLEDEGACFLQSMQEMMEQQQLLSDNNNNSNNNNNNYNDEDDIDWGDEDKSDEDWVVNEKKKKASRAAKRKNQPKNTNLDGSKRCGRLLLNDALKNINNQDGWSEARKKAWKNRKTQQNAYFYRFNVPGQPQKNGKWTDREHELFMKRVMEIGVNDQWGIFSKKIPGRVGYQCSNYWRGLVKDGEVTDPNYHFDGKKLHFKRNSKAFSIKLEYRRFAITINHDKSGVWKPVPMKHPNHPSDKYCQEVEDALSGQHIGGNTTTNNGNNKTKKRKQRKRKRQTSNDDDSDEDWNGGITKKRRRKGGRKKDETFHCSVDDDILMQEESILDMIDIMTGETVVRPAISPYGHVLGYDTWTKILRTSKHKNLCPFTLQKMTRRSLIKLTKSNIEEYRNKIVNITEEQIKLMGTLNKED